jgi:predicted amidohydrolase YtcJ
MLIQHAELVSFRNQKVTTSLADVRIEHGHVSAIGDLQKASGESVIDANHCLLLPGIHDHHVHFLSWAASLGSVPCGPPAVRGAPALSAALHAAPGDGWIRGIGYHDSVAGEITRQWLDQHGPGRPIRIQHRSGRMWIVNSLALDWLRAAASEALTIQQRRVFDAVDGRLFDADEAVRACLPGDISMVEDASTRLARLGITAFNDMTPSNSAQTFALFERMQNEGHIRQSFLMSGQADLGTVTSGARNIGATKVHLHEAGLPEFQEFIATIARSHETNRPVAVHCVTETELVYALAAFRDAGTIDGDRIEHASVVPPQLISPLRDLQLLVVTQPGFVYERGDSYLQEIPASEHGWLYRARSLIEAGIGVAFSSDMPFTEPAPWRAMQAATTRMTAGGQAVGAEEAVSPDVALASSLGSLAAPATPRTIAVSESTDLCLLDRNWVEASADLSAIQVRATMQGAAFTYLDGSWQNLPPGNTRCD